MTKLHKNPEEQTREKLIPTEKKLLFYFFKNLSEVFVTFSEKLPAWLSKLQPTWLSKISRFNNFWKSAQCLNLLLGFELIKVENIFEKKFSGFFTGCCASRGICWGKVISLFKKFYSFWCHFWKVSNFVVVLQNSLVTCLKARVTCVKNRNCENKQWNYFTSPIWDFELKKLGLSAKKHDFQNCSLRVPRNKFRNFFWSKIKCMKIFGFWTERSVFLRYVLLRVAKGAFHLSSATLWEKDDRSKLYFLRLVYDFECFFSLLQEN